MSVEIVTLWIGPRLRWLDRLSLASFVAQGHPVTLFHTDAAPDVPEGVTLARAEEVWPEIGTRLPVMPPAPIADIFRVHLMRQTAMIWADTDVICLAPFVTKDGYLIGREHGPWVNNAVLRLPQRSQALGALDAAFSDPGAIFPWLGPENRTILRRTPPEQRQAETARLAGVGFGPRALSHVLAASGEDARAMPMEILNPVPWWLGDLYFDPRGTLDHWVTDDTLCLHLYSSRLRPFHKRRRPPHGSPLARIARRIGFEEFD